MVSRILVEKKPGFDGEAQALATELQDILGITDLQGVRLINCYDVEGLPKDLLEQCKSTVFSEPQSDKLMARIPRLKHGTVFAVEALPGQFDQRADSAAQCIQLISQGERPEVRCSTVYVLQGDLTDDDVEKIKAYVINPVESREASLTKPRSLKTTYPKPAPVEVLKGFTRLRTPGLEKFRQEHGLAMDLDDLAFCQTYFKGEKRDPTITEIKVIDTYWSDHCRHTTFGTTLDPVAIDDPAVAQAFGIYLDLRRELGREAKPLCLMDMATIGAKALVARGLLRDLDESEEINACTIKVTVDVDGKDEDWLYLFKNETHNHPTEIEPFGGAATCIGGAIRDPLSGRAYVYQAMRVTGAADPTVPVSETIAGKLPQRKLTTTAAEGYSSYGNQVGLATGQVSELYHPGYAAKRMEIGAVVGATPAAEVRREEPAPGDVVLLLGGRTGRDGIGGATGSSKSHTVESIETCGAEVQKGNAPVERKLQRLFRDPEACAMIKRCNDFGAGGVSVAVGELADGLTIDLDAVPKKYEGLDGTELAISESQERMAVAVAPEDVASFSKLAEGENLEVTPIATVTADPWVKMEWRGDVIVDLSREFLASNGAPKTQAVSVLPAYGYEPHPSWLDQGLSLGDRMAKVVSDLSLASNKGLAERFDSTIGAATVLMPFGGSRQLTPAQAMVAKFPVDGETTTCSAMAWGFDPYLMEADQFSGAYLAVVESVAKLLATGFSREAVHLTFQEYFERLGDDPTRWGKPAAALLGALMAQLDLGVAAIGGKDSMSGSFEDLDVPPTLVSFATAVGSVDSVISPEFKGADHRVVLVRPTMAADGLNPTPEGLVAAMDTMEALGVSGSVLAAATPGHGGLMDTLFKMCVGNGIGFTLAPGIDRDGLFRPAYGSFVVELADNAELPASTDAVTVSDLGTTTADYGFNQDGERVDLAWVQDLWEGRLEEVFPYRTKTLAAADEKDAGDKDAGDKNADEKDADATDAVPQLSFEAPKVHRYRGPALKSKAKPRVVIPVFPGNNCEIDSARAFRRAGAEPEVLVVNNLTPEAVAESTERLAAAIAKAQMVMIPGGFSGGDEPDGSAKFITAFFRAPQVAEAVQKLLQDRDGLMLGICNGFQALIKLGLVPFGTIKPVMGKDDATLATNTIGRHQSRLVRTRVCSTLSPWFSACEVGDIHTVAISHGEGRFTAPAPLLKKLVEKGQVATQYVDEEGMPSMDLEVNPNGSLLAIEGITSPDGRVLGKMGHSERWADGLYRNVPGDGFQPIFEGGVKYFS